MKLLAPAASVLALLAFGTSTALASHGTIWRLTDAHDGGNPDGSSGGLAINGQGGLVAFHSDAENLVSDDFNNDDDVFRTSIGTPAQRQSLTALGTEATDDSAQPELSELGNLVVFESIADDLVGVADNGLFSDIFLVDLAGSPIQRVSLDSGGMDPDDNSTNPDISEDGNLVVFESYAEDLGPADSNSAVDIYLRNVSGATNTVISESQLFSGASGFAENPVISGAGGTVAWESQANNMIDGDPDNFRDIFVRDGTDPVEQVDAFDGPPPDGLGEFPLGINYGAAISDDGQVVAFLHNGDLAPGTSLFGLAVMVRDRVAQTTERVDVTWDGSPSTGNDANGMTGAADDPSISEDGRYVAFSSTEDSLVPNDTNGVQDIFVRDRLEGRTVRVNVPEAGGETALRSVEPVISDQGNLVAFASQDNGIVPGDTSSTAFWEVFEINMDWTFPDTTVQTPPPAATTATRVTTAFADDKTGSDFDCSVDGGAFAPCASPWLSPELGVGAHTFQIRSTDRFGAREADAAVANTIVQAGPAGQEPRPDFRRTFNLELVSGNVFVTLPDGRRVRLEDLLNIPAGSVVDTTAGKARLTSETKAGKLESAVFFDGLFKVAQLRSGITELRLTGPLRASAAVTAAVQGRASKRRRRLWGNGRGRFRSKGKYSSATVRGTKWLVEDRRGSTLTVVKRGSVTVRDFVKKKTVVVKKGNRYIARKRPKR